MRSRDAWLAAIAAMLGISEEACRAKDDAPAVAREVPSASAVIVPSASASANVEPSATASASAIASASVTIGTGTIGIGTIGTIGMIGTGHNMSCGASVIEVRRNAGPRANVSAVLSGGEAGDARVATMLRPRLRNCANQALRQDPTQRGHLVISAVIGADGAVRSASIATNTGLSEACATCMVVAVRTAPFPAGAERTVSIQVDQTVTESP